MHCKCCGQSIDDSSVYAMDMWTNTESKILRELEGGLIVHRDDLALRVYGIDVSGYKHADSVRNKVSVHVKRIRDKIDETGIPWTLGNIWGRGYWLREAGE